MKTALVLGGGGFIGHHMVSRLKKEGYWVRAVDLKYSEFSSTRADDFRIVDLRDYSAMSKVIRIENDCFDEIYQFAADMGGAGFVFTGENDSDIMHNSAAINLNVLDNQNRLNRSLQSNRTKIFYSSSACIYPAYNQEDPLNPNCREDSAYPANPDSEYGWEKLFSERLFLAYHRNYGMNIRIARYHNIYGPEGTWVGGRDKAPAAICRKVAEAENGGAIEIWGDGNQTRSFLYIDECIEATWRLMNQEEFVGPINIGSEEMVSINELAGIVIRLANKNLKINHVEGPVGVRGRNSSNDLAREILDWDYQMSLEEGLAVTYSWISDQVIKANLGAARL